MRNRDDGYWIAGDDPRAAVHSLTGQYSLANTATDARRIALLSDGIERVITHLHLYNDAHELLDSLFDPGTSPPSPTSAAPKPLIPVGRSIHEPHPATTPPPSRAF